MSPLRALLLVLVAISLITVTVGTAVQPEDPPAPEAGPEAATLRIVTEQGPAALAAAMQELAGAANLTVQITPRDPFGGRVNPLANQVTDILLTGMPLTKDEVMQVIEATGRPPICHVLVRDAIAVVVHRDNQVRFLTYKELNDLVAGTTSNWVDLREGLDEAILPLLPIETSDTSAWLWRNMLKGSERADSAQAIAGVEAVARIRAGAAPDTGAFTLVSNSMVTDQVRVMELAPAADKPGTVPSETTVGADVDGDRYPLTRVLYAWTLGRPAADSAAKRWINIVRSDAGQQAAVAARYFRID